MNERLIVAPDTMVRGRADACVLMFPPETDVPQILVPRSADEFEELRRLPETHYVHVRPNLSVPEKDTGRKATSSR